MHLLDETQIDSVTFTPACWGIAPALTAQHVSRLNTACYSESPLEET